MEGARVDGAGKGGREGEEGDRAWRRGRRKPIGASNMLCHTETAVGIAGGARHVDAGLGVMMDDFCDARGWHLGPDGKRKVDEDVKPDMEKLRIVYIKGLWICMWITFD